MPIRVVVLLKGRGAQARTELGQERARAARGARGRRGRSRELPDARQDRLDGVSRPILERRRRLTRRVVLLRRDLGAGGWSEGGDGRRGGELAEGGRLGPAGRERDAARSRRDLRVGGEEDGGRPSQLLGQAGGRAMERGGRWAGAHLYGSADECEVQGVGRVKHERRREALRRGPAPGAAEGWPVVIALRPLYSFPIPSSLASPRPAPEGAARLGVDVVARHGECKLRGPVVEARLQREGRLTRLPQPQKSLAQQQLWRGLTCH